MSPVTVLFVLVITLSTFCTVLLNSLTAKLSRLEQSQRELEMQLKNQFDGLPEADNAVESAQLAYNTAVAVYNESINRFPGIIIAGIFGFTAISADEGEFK